MDNNKEQRKFRKLKGITFSLVLILSTIFPIIPPTNAKDNTVIVDDDGTGDYMNISEAISNGENNIFIKDGLYEVSDTVLINYSNVSILGESRDGVIIRQTNPNKDLIQIHASHVTVDNVTLDVQTYSAQAAIVESNSDYVTLKNSKILGSDDIFAIFFAGKVHEVGDKTLEAFENNDLDSNNVIENNLVYSPWDWGDGVSFSLQKNGRIDNNTIYGSRIAFYLNRDSQSVGNTIEGGVHGIFISLPTRDSVISNNTITNISGAPIKVFTQDEHPMQNPTEHRSTGIIIENNYLDGSRYFGIEATNLKDSIIRNNIIKNIDINAMYFLFSESLEIYNNHISEIGLKEINGNLHGWVSPATGILLDAFTHDLKIYNNDVFQSKVVGDKGIWVPANENYNNNITCNRVYGDFTDTINLSATNVDATKNIIFKGETWTTQQLNKLNDITTELLKYENTHAESDLNVLNGKINDLLSEITIEDDVYTVLTDIFNRRDLVISTTAIEKAESTLLKDDYIGARSLVEALIDSNESNCITEQINDLTERYLELEKYHLALESVVLSETTYGVSDKNNANVLVSGIKNSANRTPLEGRLNDLQGVLDAIEATKQAGLDLKKESLLEAQQKVNLIVSSRHDSKKDELNQYVYSTLNAISSVETAESTKKQSDKDTAQGLVSALGVGTWKVHLQERLDAILVTTPQPEPVVLGTLIVNYVDDKGNVLDSTTLTDVPLGVYTKNAKAIDNYEVSGATTQTVTLDKDNLTRTITFTYTKKVSNEDQDTEEPVDDSDNVPVEGTITIEYVDEQGNVLKTETLSKVSEGVHQQTAKDIQGYEVVGDTVKSVTVSKTQLNHTITFTYKVKDTKLKGTITVLYLDDEGNLLDKKELTALTMGTYTETAKQIKNYEIVGSPTKDVTLSKDEPNQNITFTYKYITKEEKPKDNEPISGQITVIYTDNKGNLLDSKLLSNLLLGSYTETAKTLSGYEVVGKTTKTVVISKTNPTQIITFIYAKVNDNTTSKNDNGKLIVKYINDKGDVLDEKTVISLPHGSYTEVAKDIAGYEVKGNTIQTVILDKTNPTQTVTFIYSKKETEVTAKGVVTVRYKSDTGSVLAFKVVDNIPLGNYTEKAVTFDDYELISKSVKKVDITKKNLNPTIVFTYSLKSISKPSTPRKKPNKPESTTPKDQDSKDKPDVKNEPEVKDKPDTTTKDTNKKCSVQRTNAENITIVKDDITIIIPLKQDIKDCDIVWKNLGREHYELQVSLDGKTIKEFDKQITVKMKHPYLYLLRVEGNEYKPVLYERSKDTFTLHVKQTGTFAFTNKTETFKDIEKSFSKLEIQELASRHIVHGTDGGEQYSPKSNITRAQFAVMISRVLELKPTGVTTFTDTKGKWFEKDVQALYEAKIISGYTDSTFKPNDYITREHAVVILERVLRYTGASVPTPNKMTFTDQGAINENAKYAVSLLHTMEVVHGKEGNRFAPKDNLTREQMAKILVNALKLTEK